MLFVGGGGGGGGFNSRRMIYAVTYFSTAILHMWQYIYIYRMWEIRRDGKAISLGTWTVLLKPVSILRTPVCYANNLIFYWRVQAWQNTEKLELTIPQNVMLSMSD